MATAMSQVYGIAADVEEKSMLSGCWCSGRRAVRGGPCFSLATSVMSVSRPLVLTLRARLFCFVARGLWATTLQHGIYRLSHGNAVASSSDKAIFRICVGTTERKT